jgi:hypothetical protein
MRGVWGGERGLTHVLCCLLGDGRYIMDDLRIARNTIRMLRARIDSNRRLIRVYELEIYELNELIEDLERGITRADINTRARGNLALSPPGYLVRQPLRELDPNVIINNFNAALDDDIVESN